MTSPDSSPVLAKLEAPTRPEKTSGVTRFMAGGLIIFTTCMACVFAYGITQVQYSDKPVLGAVFFTVVALVWLAMAGGIYATTTSTKRTDEYIAALEVRMNTLQAKYDALGAETLDYRVTRMAATILAETQIVGEVVARETGINPNDTTQTGTAEPGQI